VTGHPLFLELRNGLLWHRTSVESFRKIRQDGFIKPGGDGIDRWGKYVCLQLNATSLFDFTSENEEKILGESEKWQQFLGDKSPVTVFLGMKPEPLSDCLVRYPENMKRTTTGNIIPWVEVCHCGPIPTSAIVSYLLVCAVDSRRFQKYESLDEQTLCKIEKEFGEIVRQREQEVKNNRIEGLMNPGLCPVEWAKIIAREEEQEWLEIIQALPETIRARIEAAKEAALCKPRGPL
jgi:hypothetical protein